ncbi:MAG TPA: sn-glycerol-3-phosphate ABC transporter ATP-binding protein UgpC [Anaerolineaceae bacterium]|nr:sn-glycerol-3-phosphate ABC transporter ATP-binding protein UgpC [Anaerolineaceae bacterium]
MASVTFDHVVKKFGDFTAIEDLNLEIFDEEFLVLVGPSGCGKTTALRCLAGLEEVTAGNIYIGDRLVNDVPPKDRDIAMVFQSYALYPHMSVFDNMAFGLKLRKLPKEQILQRVENSAKILGIEALLKRKPRELSGGQRQRVALGRAIVREPKVFLLDEPLSNLDAKLRVQTRAEISKIHNKLGTTFVYVTHDQTEAMTMANRIAVMNKGKLMQLDTPQVLYDKPANLFVAGFIGTPAMNFFNMKLIKEGDALFVDNGEMKIKIPETRSAIFQRLVGKDIVFGIRPDDIHNPDFAPLDIHGERVSAKVDVVELMGNEILVYMATDKGNNFVGRVDPRSKYVIGETSQLIFNMDNCHIFDPSENPENPVAVR